MDKGYIDQESFNSAFDMDQRIHIEREFSPDEGIVSRARVVELVPEEVYDNIVKVGVLDPINHTHSLLKPDYSRYSVYSIIYYLQMTFDDYKNVNAYFVEVKESMIELKIKEIL
mmetsp:Transcript_2276/g.3434  ORF Transcript_2276/g.3434 Transcript_2276/m.3434 type:complete len:114 (+) Transcript_2276:2657-2998(+)